MLKPQHIILPGVFLLITLTACSSQTTTDAETTVIVDAQAMNTEQATTNQAQAETAASNDPLQAAINAEHRSTANRARDRFRHPYATLSFFGIQPTMTVVEIWPGSGWYQEILAPYLKDQGQYIAASFDRDTEVGYQQRLLQQTREKFVAQPELYSKVITTEFQPPEKVTIAEPGSVDMVLTFRNAHSFMRAEGMFSAAFQAMFDALKPGGTLGVVAHKGHEGITAQDPQAKTGYLAEARVIEMIEQVGFEFLESSDVNSNPLDTADYPEGVWTLPPVSRAENSAEYVDRGESHRMTLKFQKPQ